MFQVVVKAPIDDQWANRETDIELAADKKWLSKGTNGTASRNGYFWYLFEEYTFDNALLLKQRLDGLTDIKAILREK